MARTEMGGLWKLGTFRPLGNWVFDKERQNEIYLEAAIRTERCNAAVRQRRVGECRRWLAPPKQGRLGIARCQIGRASPFGSWPVSSSSRPRIPGEARPIKSTELTEKA